MFGDRSALRIPGRPNRGYVPSLDGLRAIAVSLVVAHHVLPFQFGGHIGVDIFFVLSGFLITGILLREMERAGRIDFRRFYVRRAIRLYPALLTSVTVLLIPGLIFAPSLFKYVVDNVLAVTYTTPLVVIFANGASTAWRHTWSLGIEEIFYLIWPLLLTVACNKLRPRMITLASAGLGAVILSAGVFVMLLFPGVGDGDTYLFRSGGLFLGCALALHLHTTRTQPVGVSAGLAGTALVIVSVFAPHAFSAVLASSGSIFLLAHLATSQEAHLSRFLGVRPFAYVGRISYEIYLWHYPLLVIASWATGHSYFAAAVIVIPLSVILAIATQAFFAPRIDKWKVRFAESSGAEGRIGARA